jgi:NAD(P)-dependent dehydrogenase (short-subunit alcohol dehydrogenase family)
VTRFGDQVVMISGGAAGIGAATARAFAHEGARVTILDINVAEGEARADEIGGRFREVDVTDEAAVRGAVEEAVADYGRLDVMHANAAVEWTKKIVETTLEEWNRVITVNLTGVYLCCRHALARMVEQRSGSLLLTASPHGLVTVPDAGAYAASKGGVLALNRALALEGAPHNVRSNALLPGAIDTPMLRREAAMAPDPEEQVRRFGLMHPIARLGRPEEVAEAALFLASDAASFITGTALAVEGGLLAVVPSGPALSYTET